MGRGHQDGRVRGHIAHRPFVAVDLALEGWSTASVAEAASDRASDLARIPSGVGKIDEPIRRRERSRQCMLSACDGRGPGEFGTGVPGSGAQRSMPIRARGATFRGQAFKEEACPGLARRDRLAPSTEQVDGAAGPLCPLSGTKTWRCHPSRAGQAEKVGELAMDIGWLLCICAWQVGRLLEALVGSSLVVGCFW